MKKNILLLTLLSVLFASCGVNRVYTPGSYGSSTIKSYVPRPIYKDSTVANTYVGVSIGKSVVKAIREEVLKDSKLTASIHIFRGISTKNFNFHFGASATFGKFIFKYPLGTLIRKNETANFYNYTLKIGGNFRKTKVRKEKRLFGYELNYTYEFGPYQDKLTFLKGQLKPTTYIIVNKKSMFSSNVYLEKAYVLNKEKNFGYQLYIGWMLDVNKKKYKIPNDYGTNFAGFILYYTHKNYTFSMINEKANLESTTTSFGVSFKI